MHHVGVALDTREEGRLEQGSVKMVPLLALAVAGILARKHLRAFPVIVVIAASRGQEPVFGAVKMLVNEVYLQLAHLRPEVIEVLAFGVRPGRPDYLDVGICLADGLYKDLQAGRITLAPLLVAYGYELEVERRGMPHRRAEASPLRSSVAVGELDEVERVLHVASKVGHLDVRVLAIVLELARQAAANHGQRLRAHVLGQLEQLEEAHAVRLVIVGEEAVLERIVPAVLVKRTVLHGAYGVFPVVTRGQIGTLDDAAAREAEHAGLGVGQGLRQVLAQSVPAPLPRIDGEERHMLEVNASARLEEDAKVSLGKGLLRRDCNFVTLPVGRVYGQNVGSHHLRLAHRGGVYQLHLDFLALAARPYREAVALAGLHADAEKALVFQSGELRAVPRGRQAHIMGVALERAVVLQRHVAKRLPAHEMLGKLERAVFHQLGIQASVGRIIDVFKEMPVHGRLDWSANLASLHHHDVSLLRARLDAAQERQGRQ